MLYEGWMYFYGPYLSKSLVSTGRDLLQKLQVGDILKNHGIFMMEKFSQPPARFNQAELTGKDGTGENRDQSHQIRNNYYAIKAELRQYRFKQKLSPTSKKIRILGSLQV